MNHKKISVTVKLFASVKDIAKMSEATFELPDTSVADDVLSHLVEKFPAMHDLRPFIRVAVNKSYVDLTQPLHNGDEVALIPPVSGG